MSIQKLRHITVSQEAMSNSALKRLKKPNEGKVIKVYAITFRYALIQTIFLSSVA
ncbi:hypothetical protein A0R60_1782 [Enterobacter asburiae]|nr:hypothetical protein A0R60_1782 [Enterobacter asburiae]